MSKHHVHAHHGVMHDVQFMEIEDLEQQYDIEVYEDGTVWDRCEDRTFDSLDAWARFIQDLEAEDDDDTFVVKTGKRRYDDDY